MTDYRWLACNVLFAMQQIAGLTGRFAALSDPRSCTFAPVTLGYRMGRTALPIQARSDSRTEYFQIKLHPVIPLLLLSLVAAAGGCGRQKVRAFVVDERRSEASNAVVVGNVSDATMSHQEDFVGTVESLQSVEVRPPLDGKIEAIYFSEGKVVRKGELLATLESDLPRANLEQAEATLRRDQTALRDAEVSYRRTIELLKNELISQAQSDVQTASLHQLQSLVAVDQAQVKSARIGVEQTKILSPISGRAGLKQVNIGSMVKTSDAKGVVRVDEIDPVGVIFALRAESAVEIINRVHHGSQVYIEIYDASKQVKLSQGYVTAAQNELDEATGTARLKGVVVNTNEVLIPNEPVTVRLLGVSRRGLRIPIAALFTAHGRTRVYILEPSGHVREREIQVLARSSTDAVVEGTLNRGDIVITGSGVALKDGMPAHIVRAIPPK